MWAKPKSSSAFTIVELLIVIVVISVLAAITVVAYNGIQARARDTAKVQKINDIAKALEMYKADYGQYPGVALQDSSSSESSCGSQTDNWGHCDRLKLLTDLLKPYASVELISLSNPSTSSETFYYTSGAADNYQTYGMRILVEGAAGQNDGGYSPEYFEVGQKPRYCMSKYTGSSASWRAYNTLCVGGN